MNLLPNQATCIKKSCNLMGFFVVVVVVFVFELKKKFHFIE